MSVASRRGVGVTAAEVARKAGVSRATVSYILNEDPTQSFSADTKVRVQAAAAELGYIPNHAARALRVGRTTTVLFPLPDIYLSPLWAGIVEATARALAARGNTLVADFTHYGTPEAQVEAGLRLQPAAVIDTLAVDRRAIRMFEAQGAHVIKPSPKLVSDPLAEPGHRARLMQVDHLMDRGCKRIASVHWAGHDDESRQGPAVEKMLKDRCRARRVGYETHAIDPGNPRRARALVARLIGKVDGACVVNDHLAASLLSACTAAGVRVPEDLAIIGLDDHPIAAALTPSLTTIAWDLDQFASSLADAVEQTLAGTHQALPLEAMACRVIVRESA